MSDAAEVVLRLVLAPVLVCASTLVGRRVGHRIGGAVAGLPLTSGPVSFLLLLHHGAPFAAAAAVGTLRGLLSTTGFVAAFCLLSRGSRWRGLGAGLVASIGAAFLAQAASPPMAAAALAVGISTWLALMAISGVDGLHLPAAAPWWDLPLRGGIAAAMVLLLTQWSDALGPALTGLISPAPVFAAVLMTFAAGAERGDVEVGRGVLEGSFGFIAFFACCAVLLDHWGAAAYLPATVAALIVSVASRLVARRCQPRPV